MGVDCSIADITNTDLAATAIGQVGRLGFVADTPGEGHGANDTGAAGSAGERGTICYAIVDFCGQVPRERFTHAGAVANANKFVLGGIICCTWATRAANCAWFTDHCHCP